MPLEADVQPVNSLVSRQGFAGPDAMDDHRLPPKVTPRLEDAAHLFPNRRFRRSAHIQDELGNGSVSERALLEDSSWRQRLIAEMHRAISIHLEAALRDIRGHMRVRAEVEAKTVGMIAQLACIEGKVDALHATLRERCEDGCTQDASFEPSKVGEVGECTNAVRQGLVPRAASVALQDSRPRAEGLDSSTCESVEPDAQLEPTAMPALAFIQSPPTHKPGIIVGPSGSPESDLEDNFAAPPGPAPPAPGNPEQTTAAITMPVRQQPRAPLPRSHQRDTGHTGLWRSGSSTATGPNTSSSLARTLAFMPSQISDVGASLTMISGDAPASWSRVIRQRASKYSTRRNRIARCCTRENIMMSVTVVNIVSSALFIGFSENAAMQLALRGEDAPAWIWDVELAFGIAFAAEVFLLVALFGKRAFTGRERRWNSLDVVLLMATMVELSFGRVRFPAGRMLRTAKLLRLVRVIHAFRGLRHLRLMVAMIGSALSSMCWAAALLFLFAYVYGLFLMQGLARHLLEADPNTLHESWRAGVANRFGTLGASISTMLACVSGGMDWLDSADLVKTVHTGYFLSFVLFIMLMVFGVMNVLTSIFVQSTRHMVKIDRELVIDNQIEARDYHRRQLRSIFKKADPDGKGTLDMIKLKAHLQNPDVRAYLRTLDVQPSDTIGVFRLLAKDEHSEVAIEKFVVALSNIQGNAKNVDVINLLHETKQSSAKLEALWKLTSSQLTTISEALHIQNDTLQFVHISLNDEEIGDVRLQALKQTILQGGIDS